jgi:phosphoglycolate phosphatase-like HAD superfamily hydrolase
MRGAGFDDETITARMPMLLRRYTDGLVARLAEPERHISMYPGVGALIDAVDAHPDMMLGLLTGNVDRGARLKLGAVGLDFDRFRVNAFGSDSEVRAQLPAIAHARMREVTGIDLAGSDVVVIGDTPADIACGRDLGARAIAVATGRYSVEELAAHAPYAVFEDLGDTDAVMAAIEGRVGAESTQSVER